MNQVFVVGDVHGCLSMLEKLLDYWHPEKERLIFIGDLIDRGENSLGVVRLAMKLQNEYDAVIIGGNHEDLFLEWLENPMSHASDYFRMGGTQTVSSFIGEDRFHSLSYTHLSEQILQSFPEEIEFLKSLPDYMEWKNYLFVHAGVNLDLNDWKSSGSKYFRSIREPFHQGTNRTGKVIIFGHTPTRRLHADKRNDVWISPCKTKIGIDGGAVFGGMLHGIHIRANGECQLYSINSEFEITCESVPFDV